MRTCPVERAGFESAGRGRTDGHPFRGGHAGSRGSRWSPWSVYWWV